MRKNIETTAQFVRPSIKHIQNTETITYRYNCRHTHKTPHQIVVNIQTQDMCITTKYVFKLNETISWTRQHTNYYRNQKHRHTLLGLLGQHVGQA